MSNANVLAQLDAQAYYMPDGFQDAVRWLRGSHARLFPADDLKIFRVGASAKVDVQTSASRIVLVSAVNGSASTAISYIQLFNVAAASVTLGTTVPDEVIKLTLTPGAGKTKVNYEGPVDVLSYPTSLSLAVTTAPTGATPATAPNSPSLIVVYA